MSEEELYCTLKFSVVVGPNGSYERYYINYPLNRARAEEIVTELRNETYPLQEYKVYKFCSSSITAHYE